MLPEKLSNELCSLRPNEDKLTFSAVFELDKDARVVNKWFGRTVIHSDRRFTYEEAQERIDTKKGDFVEEIIVLNTLAKKMQKKRFENGAITFETVEVRFELDEKGKPVKVVPKVRVDAHKLIEEFMLLANKKVAEFIGKAGKNKAAKTFVYRIHDEPNQDKLLSLSNFVKQFGYNFKVNELPEVEFPKPLGNLTNLALLGRMNASSMFIETEKLPGFEAFKANDENKETRWLADEIQNQYLEVEWVKPQRFNTIVIDEHEDNVSAYKLQYLVNGEWNNIYEGTNCGSNKIHTFKSVSSTKCRLFIVDAKQAPSINEIEILLD